MPAGPIGSGLIAVSIPNTGTNTNLTGKTAQSNFTIENDNGTGVVIPNSNKTTAGVMSGNSYTKLDGIQESAQQNDSKVKINSTDSKGGFLSGKLTGSKSISVSEIGEGDNKSLELSTSGGSTIGGVTVSDIAGEGLYFETINDESYVIPQVFYNKGTEEMGVPFFYSKKPIHTAEIDGYTLQSDVILSIPYGTKSGFSYQGTDNVSINAIKLSIPSTTVGKYISVKFGYFPKDSGARVFAYTGRVLITSEGDNVLPFPSSFQIGTDSSIAKSLSLEISEAEHETAGSPIDFAKVFGGPDKNYPWWKLISSSTGEKTEIATQDFAKAIMPREVYNKTESPTAYTTLVNHKEVINAKVGTGGFIINFGCGFKCASSNDARWCQAELFVNGVLIGMATNGISNIGTQSNYCSIEKSITYSSKPGDTKADFTLNLSSSNASKIQYRGLTMSIIKMGEVT